MLIPRGREKHLLFLIENKQKLIPRGVYPEAEQQIPRFARNDKRGDRDDNRRGLFHQPARVTLRYKTFSLSPAVIGLPTAIATSLK
jgi:hypothetical protein